LEAVGGKLKPMNKRVQTDFLFAQPSFLSGAARVLDLWCQFDDYNLSDSGSDADSKAISADWCIVGQDLWDALQVEDLASKAA
jgi:hypothetical protein